MCGWYGLLDPRLLALGRFWNHCVRKSGGSYKTSGIEGVAHLRLQELKVLMSLISLSCVAADKIHWKLNLLNGYMASSGYVLLCP